jgi:hypothetical protein
MKIQNLFFSGIFLLVPSTLLAGSCSSVDSEGPCLEAGRSAAYAPKAGRSAAYAPTARTETSADAAPESKLVATESPKPTSLIEGILLTVPQCSHALAATIASYLLPKKAEVGDRFLRLDDTVAWWNEAFTMPPPNNRMAGQILKLAGPVHPSDTSKWSQYIEQGTWIEINSEGGLQFHRTEAGRAHDRKIEPSRKFRSVKKRIGEMRWLALDVKGQVFEVHLKRLMLKDTLAPGYDGSTGRAFDVEIKGGFEHILAIENAGYEIALDANNHIHWKGPSTIDLQGLEQIPRKTSALASEQKVRSLVAALDRHYVLLHTGEVLQFERWDEKPKTISAVHVEKIAVTSQFALLLDHTGLLYAVGAGELMQIKFQGIRMDMTTPVLLPIGRPIIDIEARGLFAIAISEDHIHFLGPRKLVEEIVQVINRPDVITALHMAASRKFETL